MEQDNEPKVFTPHQSNHENLKGISSVLFIFVMAPLVAFLLTLFVFQSYQVDGPSMETTLQHSDRLIVSKIPRTWSELTGNAYIPNRGDIIIFHRNSGGDFGGSDKQLIKRVVALPGERVTVKRGVLTVYNQENPNGFRPDQTMDYGSVIGLTEGSVDLVVGEDEVFVSGDNRGNSLDSRNFGPIKAEEIVGKLEYRVFPFNKFESF